MKSPPRWAWPLGILAFALTVRLIFFTGVQGQDDRLYSASAYRLLHGEHGPSPDLFRTRLGYEAPVAALYGIFGVHFACLIAPSLLASLGLVGLAYRLGHTLKSAPIGRTAALFVAVLPLDVFNATCGGTDLVLAAWIGLGVWLLAEPGMTRTPTRRIVGAISAGLAWGAAHLTKESGILLILPAVPVVWSVGARKSLAIAGAVALGVVLLESAAYGWATGDPLYRVHLAQTTQGTANGNVLGFWAALQSFPSVVFDPRNILFPFTGGLATLSAGGSLFVAIRDRARMGAVALWWLGAGLVLTLFPISLFPYRVALHLQGRMLAAVTLPGSILASILLVESLGSRRPRLAWSVGIAAGLLSTVCAARLHQDGLRWRIGLEWAHRELASHPGAPVITDPRTAETLRMMTSYAPEW